MNYKDVVYEHPELTENYDYRYWNPDFDFEADGFPQNTTGYYTDDEHFQNYWA